jgi:hypothetical protein
MFLNFSNKNKRKKIDNRVKWCSLQLNVDIINRETLSQTDVQTKTFLVIHPHVYMSP